MENIQEPFREFLHRVVLPQKSSYLEWINPRNSAVRLNEIKIRLQQENTDFDPFEFDPADREGTIRRLRESLKPENNTSFEAYNLSARNGVPKALLNTHLVNFIRYYKQEITFSLFQEVVDLFHTQVGNFCRHFQEKRVKYNELVKPWSTSKIFGSVRDNYWTINTGSEKEIQYHLFMNGEKIGYGLAFNAQPSQNNLQPVETVQPFIDAFFTRQQQIRELLPDYHYIENDETMLRNISSGNFVCFGKMIPLTTKGDLYVLDGLAFLEMVYDLQNKQYKAWQTIFEGRNQLIQNKKTMEEAKLLKYKHQIILQGAPGTGKTYTAKNIAEELIFGSVSPGKKEQAERLVSSNQFKMVQFHPSYTYEDFVRGIVVDSEEGTLNYNAKNKTLMLFVEQALNNLEESKKDGEVRGLSEEGFFEQALDSYKKYIAEKIEGETEFKIPGTTGYVFEVNDAYFKYRFKSTNESKPHLYYSDLKKIWKNRDSIFTTGDVKSLQLDAKGRESYYFHTFKDIQQFIKEQKLGHLPVELKNYVLIIDEINRANLPAVLGELIYALEYRGEKVASMYAVEGDTGLTLPPNLYIIGTMNTADRSVGQIDYAIRRRFAFIDVHPQDLSTQLGADFHTAEYEKVKELFSYETHLSREFKPLDVQLGHSYFIQQYEKDEEGNTDHSKPIDFRLRIEYEIKPILREYVKDGILKENAGTEIEKL